MQGRAFLDVARRLSLEKTEADWRSAANRAYYALMQEACEALERWGFVPGPRENVHTFVRLRFIYGHHQDLHSVGYTLDRLVQLRNRADYQLKNAGSFTSPQPVQQAVSEAQDAIDLLDQMNADPARQTTATAAIRAAFP
jgi:hypothetical protein